MVLNISGLVWYIPIVHLLYPLYYYLKHVFFFAHTDSGAPFNVSADLALAQISGMTAIFLIVGLYGWFSYFKYLKVQIGAIYITAVVVSVGLPWVAYALAQGGLSL